MPFLELVKRTPTVWLAWGLVMLAHIATEIVVGEEAADRWPIVVKALVVLLGSAWGLSWMLRRQVQVSGLTMVLSILAMAGPLLLEPLWRIGTSAGHPLEVQLLIGFRNLSLVLLFWSESRRVERLTVLSSLFALLFCVTTSPDISLVLVSAVYLPVGVCWLCTVYWSALKTERVVGDQASAPWMLLSGLAGLLLVSVFLVSLPSEIRTRMVEGIMPSSGGTGRADEFARSGVGDGDALVPGTERAMSFAPIEDAPFIEGQEPSLYDVFQDSYGKPKPPKTTDRAISLPPELFTANHHRMAEARKSGKSFSMERQPGKRKGHRHVRDTDSSAILHLVGRVPVHLRVETYDLFDGYEWFPEEQKEGRKRELSVVQLGEKPWIRWAMPTTLKSLAPLEPHALRVMNVDTNRILAPVNLAGVHIDLCDRTDLFRWAQPDVLAMDRKKLPGMTVIHVQSRPVDEWKLRRDENAMFGGLPVWLQIPEGPGMEEIRRLAQEWTVGIENRWQKVEAIRDRLRQEYLHDEEVTVPDDCENPVLWFLTESRRGPDYLFAGSAVLLCRSLGISSRAVSGFYAHPAHYDPLARQTSVYPEETHWWAEVNLGGMYWVTLETTPGYETLAPRRELLTWLWLGISESARWLLRHWLGTLVVCFLAGWAWLARRRIQARLLTWGWRFRHEWCRTLGKKNQTAEEVGPLLLDSLRVLDRKLNLAGSPRPQAMSFSRYFRSHPWPAEQAGLSEAELRNLSRWCDWATYSARPFPLKEASPEDVRRLCRSLIVASRRQHANESSSASRG